MKIGIGLPNPIPGTDGATLVQWARSAELRGFSTVATIDRLVYPSYESMIALAAAGAVTSRIGLMTNILLAPTRNPVLLAKEAASVDQISGGRLTLGMAVGSREDDYEVAERPFRNRGRRWDREIEQMLQVWRGEPLSTTGKAVGPAPVRGSTIPIVFGGTSDQSVRRLIRWGKGWTAGGGLPEQVGPFVDRIRGAWADAGRDGAPIIVCLSYFALGDGAGEGALRYLSDYYGEWGEKIAARVPTSPDAVRDVIGRFEAVGADELIFGPTIGDLGQVDALAEAVL